MLGVRVRELAGGDQGGAARRGTHATQLVAVTVRRPGVFGELRSRSCTRGKFAAPLTSRTWLHISRSETTPSRVPTCLPRGDRASPERCTRDQRPRTCSTDWFRTCSSGCPHTRRQAMRPARSLALFPWFSLRRAGDVSTFRRTGSSRPPRRECRRRSRGLNGLERPPVDGRAAEALPLSANECFVMSAYATTSCHTKGLLAREPSAIVAFAAPWVAPAPL